MSSVRTIQSLKNVVLFSGHMIDAPDRKTRRFPADKEPIAAEAIANALTTIGASRGDLAICGGACGGDLLFAEASLARGLDLELFIPFEEPTFLANSVDFADANWRERFLATKSRAVLHVMPNELGPLAEGDDPYERNNRWMLDAATQLSNNRMIFISLWDGQSGDGPGGAKHLMEQARNRALRVYWLDTSKLWD
jgi:hypothetical protein